MSGPRSASRRSRQRVRQLLARQEKALEASRWREALTRHACHHVYHWTPIGNLMSILRHGLLTGAELSTARIPVSNKWSGSQYFAASAAASCSVSLGNYHVGLARKSPERGVVAVISAEYALGEGCQFRDPAGPIASGRDSLATFEGLWQSRTSSTLNSAVEVLVPSGIPATAIAEIWVRAAGLDEVEAAVAAAPSGVSPVVRSKVLAAGSTPWLISEMDLSDVRILNFDP